VIAKWPAEMRIFTDSWNDEKIIHWWTDKGFTNGKIARTAFMKEPNTNGKSSSFEALWKENHPDNKVGRPPRKSAKAS
jgi:hypothetical protein